MLIDTFPYFNERELLELRIRLLYDHVDKFIICEGDRNHKGDPKPYVCKDTIRELGLPEDKIQIVEVKLPSAEEDPDPMTRDRLQRNAAAEFIREGDVAIVSDCDEIIDPAVLEYYTSLVYQVQDRILRLPLVNLNARADLRAYTTAGQPVEWPGPYLCGNFHIQNWTLSELRESVTLGIPEVGFIHTFSLIEGRDTLGWHFTWMGGSTRRHIKIKSFAHWKDDVGAPGNLNTEEMHRFVQEFIPSPGQFDMLGRQDVILQPYDINELPDLVFKIPALKKFLFSN